MTAIWLDYFKNCDKTARRRKSFRLPAVIPIVLYNGERRWTASHRFKQMIEKADLFKKYVVDFEYVLVSVNDLKESEIRKSNTLVDNIFLADKKQTKEDWTNNVTELLQGIRKMEKNDLNEWITWFSNVIKELDERERNQFIEQLREGDERIMCSSFERLLMKEKIEGKIEGTIENIIELLEEIRTIPEALKEQILNQTNIEVLKYWLKSAAKAASIRDFEKLSGLEK